MGSVLDIGAREVLVLRRRRPIGEPPDLEPGTQPGTYVLHRIAGAGRLLHSLAELGVQIRNVVQSVHDPGVSSATIEALALGRQFVCVILGSHLVNEPDAALRQAYLAAARRHLVGDSDVLVEHHPVDWASTAEETPSTPGGSELGMSDVVRDPPFVSATSVYDVGGRIVRQRFTARVLSESELETGLRAAGLLIRRRLSPTWILAGPVPAGC
jgi:hypothetical protein